MKLKNLIGKKLYFLILVICFYSSVGKAQNVQVCSSDAMFTHNAFTSNLFYNFSNAISTDDYLQSQNGLLLDATAPIINYTPLTFTCGTSDRILDVSISDIDGVPTSGTLVPRIYFKKNANGWVSTPGVITSGTATNATFTFTILNGLMGGVNTGDVISYFIIAQDVAGTPNIGANPGLGLSAASVNSISIYPTTPNNYSINNTMGGTYQVGVGQTFTTLTEAINTFNNSCLGGSVFFILTDPVYNEAGSMTIFNPNHYSSGSPYVLYIQPDFGITTTINATVPNGAVFKVMQNGVNFIGDQDGIGDLATRNLTINNLSTVNPSVFWLASYNASEPINNFFIGNTNIINGATTAPTFVLGDATNINASGFCSSIAINRCNIQKGSVGIYMNCSNSNVSTGGFSVSECLLNSTGANAIGNMGIYMKGSIGGFIGNNEIGNFVNNTDEIDRGVWFDFGVDEVTFINNKITNIGYVGSNGFAGQGIVLSTGFNNVTMDIANNFVSNIYGTGDAYTTNGAAKCPVGIYLFGANQLGTNIQFNSINMYGSTLNSANAYSFGVAIDDGSRTILKNNIIHNSLGRSGSIGEGAVGVGIEESVITLVAFTSDYNDYYMASNIPSGNFFGKLGAANYSTLATWQAAIAREANAKNVLPVFVSNSDLHLIPSSNPLLNNAATASPSITLDIDYDIRNATTPDIGADEFTATGCLVTGGSTIATPNTAQCRGEEFLLSLTGASSDAGFTYQWQSSPNGTIWTNIASAINTTLIVNPFATTYYQCIVTCTSGGTTSSSTPWQVIVNPASNPSGLAATIGGAQVCKTLNVSATGTNYIDNSCNLIARVEPSGSPAVTGSINACVKIDASVQVDADGIPYVQRHFDVEPAVNAANAQAVLKMYFTQAEFDNFNNYIITNALGYPLLPITPIDNGNAKITQFHGTGSQPGNYVPGNISFGIPILTWISANNWWEVSFPVQGFSGFYLHTGGSSLLTTPNNVQLDATIVGEHNNVQWITDKEINNQKFSVEKSLDGTNFFTIGDLATKAINGNSSTPLQYSFLDVNASIGKQYYRLQIMDKNGAKTYSQIVSLQRNINKLKISNLQPNPTNGKVFFKILGTTSNKIITTVRTLTGKVVMQSNTFTGSIDLHHLTSGMYILEVFDRKTNERDFYKIIKQ